MAVLCDRNGLMNARNQAVQRAPAIVTACRRASAEGAAAVISLEHTASWGARDQSRRASCDWDLLMFHGGTFLRWRWAGGVQVPMLLLQRC